MNDILNQVYFGNTVATYLWSLGSFLASVILLQILKQFILKRLNRWIGKKTGDTDNIVVPSINKYLIPLMYLGSIYLSIKLLVISPNISRIISIIFLGFLVFFITLIASAMLQFIFEVYAEKISDDPSKVSAIGWLNRLSKVLIWIVAIILFVQNTGADISALVAGLGIGGIAIAFAAQAILEDVFSYFTIFFDRPFEIGDFIILGDYMGTVEHIGIRTTRLRSINGEQLIFSNKDLTNSRVKNYKRMEQRRVLFSLGVTYDTSLEQLKQIPEIMQAIIEEQSETQFDRAHFYSYGASSLNFEIVYYVLSSEYNHYMDIQQAINFAIKERFDQLGIEFAFPTQTIHVQSSTLLSD